MDFLPAAFRPGRDRFRSVEDGMADSGMSDSTLQQPPIATRRPTIIMMADDPLSTFRHMVGIHSTRSLAPTGGPAPDLSHNNLHFDGRAAPNLGIYNRIVHREQEAKRGYKFASLLINGCLGLQIIVAAALTAMGAAGAKSVPVTIFGAVNTIIAGMLTYLKGSGLPNRLRYYENEWKKVREYIEQRERDFSHPNCKLDVFEVVRVIEAMYEEVKADVQTNTPDSYISVGDIRARATATNPQVPRINELTPHARKFQDLELKYGPRIAEFLEGLAHKEEERLKHLEKGFDYGKTRAVNAEKDLEKGFEYGKTRAMNAEKDLEKGFDYGKTRAVSAEKDLEKELETRASRIGNLGRDIAREAERSKSAMTMIARDVDDEIHSPTHKTNDHS